MIILSKQIYLGELQQSIVEKQARLCKNMIAEHHSLSLSTFGSDVTKMMQCHFNL